MSLNPYARFEFADDKYGFRYWMEAPRVGYSVLENPANGDLTLRIDSHERVACIVVTKFELLRDHDGWRDAVAANLHALRKFVRGGE